MLIFGVGESEQDKAKAFGETPLAHGTDRKSIETMQRPAFHPRSQSVSVRAINGLTSVQAHPGNPQYGEDGASCVPDCHRLAHHSPISSETPIFQVLALQGW